MLRKLLLVGLLSVVEQGSTVQVCAGLATSFVCFAAHVYTSPYRHTEGVPAPRRFLAHLLHINCFSNSVLCWIYP
jgi:hypothetical protein